MTDIRILTIPAPPPKPARPGRSVAIGLAVGVFMFLCQTLPLLPGPDVFETPAFVLLEAAVLSVFPFLFALVAAPALFVLALYTRKPLHWARLALCLALMLSVAAAAWLGNLVRDLRFEAVGNRAKPVIQKLEAGRVRTGRYPDSIDLPSTGMVAYPRFKYRLHSEEGYELAVECSTGILNWDRFVYWPSRGYPSSMYGGWVERIGDWAYVHE